MAYTKAAIALHNYLRVTESTMYCPPGFVDSEDGDSNIVSGSWQEDDACEGLIGVGQVGGDG